MVPQVGATAPKGAVNTKRANQSGQLGGTEYKITMQRNDEAMLSII